MFNHSYTLVNYHHRQTPNLPKSLSLVVCQRTNISCQSISETCNPLGVSSFDKLARLRAYGVNAAPINGPRSLNISNKPLFEGIVYSSQPRQTICFPIGRSGVLKQTILTRIYCERALIGMVVVSIVSSIVKKHALIGCEEASSQDRGQQTGFRLFY